MEALVKPNPSLVFFFGGVADRHSADFAMLWGVCGSPHNPKPS